MTKVAHDLMQCIRWHAHAKNVNNTLKYPVYYTLPYVKACYHLVASSVQVFRFMDQLDVWVGIVRMHGEARWPTLRAYRGPGSLYLVRFSHGPHAVTITPITWSPLSHPPPPIHCVELRYNACAQRIH